jgi:small subunit ribosomal protein S6
LAANHAYDLIVLIDADAEEDRRGAIVDELKKQIAGGEGDLKGDIEWGVRRLAYEIDHHPEAYYHLFQLESSTELLRQLDHSLSINDQVLRHRVIKLPKGAPDRPPRLEPTPRAPEQAEQPAAEAPSPPAEVAASPPAEVAASPPAEVAASPPAEVAASPAPEQTSPEPEGSTAPPPAEGEAHADPTEPQT